MRILSFEKFTLNEIIRKEHGKYVVRTRDGKRKLGTHDTEEEAEKQLAAIEISKHMHEGLDGGFDDYTPSIFGHTIYRLPNADEIKEFADADLTVDKFINGLHYTIVGRGVLDDSRRNMILQSAELIAAAHPSNSVYREAVEKLTCEYATKNV